MTNFRRVLKWNQLPDQLKWVEVVDIGTRRHYQMEIVGVYKTATGKKVYTLQHWVNGKCFRASTKSVRFIYSYHLIYLLSCLEIS